METFRCPTCIGVLPDAHASRCTSCGQGLRRRHPRVLGEERRLAAATLPVDRWMLDRLHGEKRRGRRTAPRTAPLAWHGRFAPSPRSAEPELVLPPVAEPPAPASITVPEPESVPAFDAAMASDTALLDAPVLDAPALDAPVLEPAPADVVPPVLDDEPAMAATVDALNLDAFIAPESPAALLDEPDVVEPDALDDLAQAFGVFEPAAPPAPPAVTPRPIVTHDELDPDVRALVDDLYAQARAELAGDMSTLPANPALEAIVVDEPREASTAEVEIDEHDDEVPPAPSASTPSVPRVDTTVVAPEPPAPAPAPAPRDDNGANGTARASGVERPTRGGWVAAFVTDDLQLRPGPIAD